MRPSLGRTAISIPFVIAAVLMQVGIAGAEVSMEVVATGQVALGGRHEVTARILDDGAPVAGTVVVLTRAADIAGVSGRLELARATTDSDGVAVLSYQQRAQDPDALEVTLEMYPGIETVFEVEVFDVERQLYKSRSGVEVPGLNVLLLVAIIGGVWVAMLFAIRLLSRLAPEETEGALEHHRSVMPRLLGTLTGGIGLVLLIVLARNPTTHANLEGPEGHERTPHAHVGELTPYTGFGLADPGALLGDPVGAGRAAYVGYGCIGCHGSAGAGALVGGDLASVAHQELESFIRDVRRGPEVMPKYPESVIDAEVLALIHTYLEEEAGP